MTQAGRAQLKIPCFELAAPGSAERVGGRDAGDSGRRPRGGRFVDRNGARPGVEAHENRLATVHCGGEELRRWGTGVPRVCEVPRLAHLQIFEILDVAGRHLVGFGWIGHGGIGQEPRFCGQGGGGNIRRGGCKRGEVQHGHFGLKGGAGER